MKHELPQGGGIQIERRLGDAIFIVVNGEPVLVEVREIRTRKVKLAIIADRKKVAVVRYEIAKGNPPCEL